MKFYHHVLLSFSLIALAACTSKSPAPVSDRGAPSQAGSSARSQASAKDLYTVKRGDTLYSIAQANGVDHREIVALNNIDNPNRLIVGQQLRLRPAAVDNTAGVKTQPVGSGSSSGIEQRPLDAPVAGAAAGAAVASSASNNSNNSPQFKSEPKAGKVPYSEEALAQAQRDQQAATPSIVPPPAKPPTSKPGDAAGADEVTWAWPASGALVGRFGESGAKGIAIGGKAGESVLAAGEGKVLFAGNGPRGYGQLIIIKHNETFLSAYAHNQKLLVKEGQVVNRGQKIAEMGNTDADQVKLHFEIRRQATPVDPMKYLPPR